MTNFDRNVRTLIACFVIAIFGLVPLRFVEVANSQMQIIENQRVLGATTVNEKKTEIDLTKRCLTNDEILKMIGVIQGKIDAGNLNEQEIDGLVLEVRQIHAVRCN